MIFQNQKYCNHTSHHTHYVIEQVQMTSKNGSKSKQGTLDHSIMYIFAVALEDGKWHHIKSYTPERANRKSTINLWNKIKTVEDPLWTKKYHDLDPKKKSFGGKVVIEMSDGKTIEEEKEVADAHPNGSRPFKRENYVSKFKELTDGIISKPEAKRFLNLVQNLKNLKSKDLKYLNPKIKSSLIKRDNKKTSIFS